MTRHHGAKAGKVAGGKRLENSTKQFWPGWLAKLSANHNQTPGVVRLVEDHAKSQPDPLRIRLVEGHP